ncbi:hypothetical protein LINGRAHAP2_LOCUS3960 [Linum grandiflorum]
MCHLRGRHIYDSHRQQPMVIAEMTRTQRRTFLRKNAQTRQGQYTSTHGKEVGTFRRNGSLQANIKVDNSMSTGHKVTVLDKGKQVQSQGDNTVQVGMGENLLDVLLDGQDDKPWGNRMARLGGRINLAAKVARQGRSSHQILREFHEAGHKNVGLLGENRGRFHYFVLYQGPETTSSVPIENPTWGPTCDEETGSSSVKEENMVEVEAAMVLTTLKGKEVMLFGLEGANAELDQLVVFKEPEPSMLRHLRPLYIKARLDGIPMSKILVDNGAAVNVLPTRMLRKLGKNIGDLGGRLQQEGSSQPWWGLAAKKLCRFSLW